MKIKEVKETVEKVVRVEYIAEDGKVFYNEEECKKYEESALFAINKELKRLNIKELSVYDLIGSGSEDDSVEIFNVQTEKDLENLRRYLYLKARKYGASEKTVQECFVSESGARKDYVFDGVTIGHEVIICWSYDCDWFWVYRDGSIEGYLSFLREKMMSFIKKEEAE